MNQKISLLMVVIALALLNFPAQAQKGSSVLGGDATRSFPAKTGYKYVGPHFVAPGYWGKVGAWTNPTNKSNAPESKSVAR